jgi:hypothetical protein
VSPPAACAARLADIYISGRDFEVFSLISLPAVVPTSSIWGDKLPAADPADGKQPVSTPAPALQLYRMAPPAQAADPIEVGRAMQVAAELRNAGKLN